MSDSFYLFWALAHQTFFTGLINFSKMPFAVVIFMKYFWCKTLQNCRTRFWFHIKHLLQTKDGIYSNFILKRFRIIIWFLFILLFYHINSFFSVPTFFINMFYYIKIDELYYKGLPTNRLSQMRWAQTA